MSWHQTIIVGNLGGDPELRYLQNGRAVCNFSVAVFRTLAGPTIQRAARAHNMVSRRGLGTAGRKLQYLPGKGTSGVGNWQRFGARLYE